METTKWNSLPFVVDLFSILAVVVEDLLEVVKMILLSIYWYNIIHKYVAIMLSFFNIPFRSANSNARTKMRKQNTLQECTKEVNSAHTHTHTQHKKVAMSSNRKQTYDARINSTVPYRLFDTSALGEKGKGGWGREKKPLESVWLCFAFVQLLQRAPFRLRK